MRAGSGNICADINNDDYRSLSLTRYHDSVRVIASRMLMLTQDRIVDLVGYGLVLQAGDQVPQRAVRGFLVRQESHHLRKTSSKMQKGGTRCCARQPIAQRVSL